MKQLLVIIIALLSFGLIDAQIDEDLLIYYPFNGNTLDASGNLYHGSPSGVAYSVDRFGNSNSVVSFDGIDDFIDLPNDSELKPNLPVSFSFWVKYESTSHEDRALFNTSFENERSSGVYFNTQISSGNYAINYGDGSPFYNSTARRTYTSNLAISGGEEWHHVVAIVESSLNMKIYVDCIEHGGSYSGTGGDIEYSMTPGSLGRRDRDLNVPALYFKGKLDDFAYWNRAISFDEVIYLCENGPLGVIEVMKPYLKIIPSPARDIISIKSNIEGLSEITIYNAIGMLVYSGVFSSEVDVSNLSSGFYYLRVTGAKFSQIEKIIIE